MCILLIIPTPVNYFISLAEKEIASDRGEQKSMAKQKTLRVAAVQAAPVGFDLEMSLKKLGSLTAEAALAGANLVVFP